MNAPKLRVDRVAEDIVLDDGPSCTPVSDEMLEELAIYAACRVRGWTLVLRDDGAYWWIDGDSYSRNRGSTPLEAWQAATGGES